MAVIDQQQTYDILDVDAVAATLAELHIYGSAAEGRVGMYIPDETRDTSVNATEKFMRTLRKRQYELKDHLGNVRVVLSDLKRSGVNGINRAPWDPDVLSYSNYYPYGMLQPDRYWNAPSYRYGFNGKEKDDEVHSDAVTGAVAGEGNSYDYGFRVYDARVGRFLSVDPLAAKFAALTPYQFASNTPVVAIDLDGLEAVLASDVTKEQAERLKSTRNVVTIDYLWQDPTGTAAEQTTVSFPMRSLVGDVPSLASTPRPLISASGVLAYGMLRNGEEVLSPFIEGVLRLTGRSPEDARQDGPIWRNEANAFRHYLMQTLMTLVVGPKYAKRFGDMHEHQELDESEPDLSDTYADIVNNEFARNYAGDMLDRGVTWQSITSTNEAFASFLNVVADHVVQSTLGTKYAGAAGSIYRASDPLVQGLREATQSAGAIANTVLGPTGQKRRELQP